MREPQARSALAFASPNLRAQKAVQLVKGRASEEPDPPANQLTNQRTPTVVGRTVRYRSQNECQHGQRFPLIICLVETWHFQNDIPIPVN